MRSQLAQHELGKRHRLRNQEIKSVHALLTHKTVRIFGVRQKDKIYAFLLGQNLKAILQGSPGRFSPGLIAIKAVDDAIDLPQQFLYMRSSRCSTERRHRITDAMLRQGHNVHVTLNDNDRILLAQSRTGLRQPKDLAPLFKQRGFRRIEILRLTIAHNPPAKGNHFAFLVHDRKHHTVTKTVIEAPLLVFDHQPGLLQFNNTIVVERSPQILPAIRRITDAKFLCDFPTEASPFQVINSRCGEL